MADAITQIISIQINEASLQDAVRGIVFHQGRRAAFAQLLSYDKDVETKNRQTAEEENE